jgi:hypothetical protein
MGIKPIEEQVLDIKNEGDAQTFLQVNGFDPVGVSQIMEKWWENQRAKATAPSVTPTLLKSKPKSKFKSGI